MSETPFNAAIRTLLANAEVMRRYPDGISAQDVMRELGERFPLCTEIDAADELKDIYTT